MTRLPRPYRMVIALDESEYVPVVVEHALDLAVRHDATDLHFITVVANKRDLEPVRQRLADELAEDLSPVRDAPGTRRVRIHVSHGKPVTEICRFAADVDADLLVVGRFGATGHDHSLATEIVESAPCPVLVVGLTERGVAAEEQCPACVAIREQTNAEVLFCDEHRGDPALHISSVLPWTSDIGTPHMR